MTGWQKFTVLMVGLICIAVICYYFEQAGDSSNAQQAGITLEQTGAASEPVQPPVRTVRDGENRSRIAMADLVAQFTDLYEQPQPQDADAVEVADAGSRDGRPDRPTWSMPTASVPPAAVAIEPSRNTPGMPDFSAMFAGAEPADNAGIAGPFTVVEESLPSGDPTMLAFAGDEEHAADPVVRDVRPIAAANNVTVRPAADLGPIQPQVLTVGGEQHVGPAPAAAITVAGNRGSTNAGTLGINDLGAGSRETTVTPSSARSYDPPITTREPVAASNESTRNWQQSLVRPDPLPIKAKPASTTVGRRTYTVQSGDTFSSIAITVFGTERRYIDIVNANPDIDPRRLKVGQVINLPGNSPAAAVTAIAAAEPVRTSERFHVVGVGDNLSNIANRYYSDASKWQDIHKANRDLIGPNPNKLKAGMKLTIPTL